MKNFVSFRSTVQCCHPKFSPFSGSLSPPIREEVLPPFSEMQDHFYRSTETAMAAVPFWRERTGPTDEAEMIHSFGCFVCSHMHKGARKERGSIFSGSDWNQLFFSLNFNITWWYCYFIKQSYCFPLKYKVCRKSRTEWRWSWEIYKSSSGPVLMDRVRKLPCSRTLSFEIMRPESWGFICRWKHLMSQDLVSCTGRVSLGGIVSLESKYWP